MTQKEQNEYDLKLIHLTVANYIKRLGLTVNSSRIEGLSPGCYAQIKISFTGNFRVISEKILKNEV